MEQNGEPHRPEIFVRNYCGYCYQVMAVARRLKMKLQALGYRVIMTRDRDVELSLQKRVEIANAVKESAIFISIHFNSGARAGASGIETFTLSPNNSRPVNIGS